MKRKDQYEDYDLFFKAFISKWCPITGEIPFALYCRKSRCDFCAHVKDFDWFSKNSERISMGTRACRAINEMRTLWGVPPPHYDSSTNYTPYLNEIIFIARYTFKCAIKDKVYWENRQWEPMLKEFCQQKGFTIWPESAEYRMVSMEATIFALHALFALDGDISHCEEVYLMPAELFMRQAKADYTKHLELHAERGRKSIAGSVRGNKTKREVATDLHEDIKELATELWKSPGKQKYSNRSIAEELKDKHPEITLSVHYIRKIIKKPF